VERIKAVVLHAQTGYDSYEADWKFISKRYIKTTWDTGIIPKMKALGKKIKENDPDAYIVW
jgi:hypothetical protein